MPSRIRWKNRTFRSRKTLNRAKAIRKTAPYENAGSVAISGWPKMDFGMISALAGMMAAQRMKRDRGG
ncbi:hypothetical protein LCGC14_2880990 [marine sediment metagenome]|uniref:Uncharacterized protein n=1 Tax=marine sediment metagenome TaxID=412755 RepID=A0A0F8Y0C1_9ZZZZ